MAALKVHYRLESNEHDTCCGLHHASGKRITGDFAAVTCRSCRRYVKLWVAVWKEGPIDPLP